MSTHQERAEWRERAGWSPEGHWPRHAVPGLLDELKEAEQRIDELQAVEAENDKLREALGIVWVACPKGAKGAVRYDYPEIADLAEGIE